MRLGKRTAVAIARLALVATAAGVAALGAGRSLAQPGGDVSWPTYDGDAAGQHHSQLSQINRSNVAKLQQVWRFDAGVGGLETSPIVVGNVLYAYTTTQRAIALDATTGQLIWKFDPGTGSQQPARGLTYWSDGADRRLFVTNASDLYCLDPATGKPIESFGEGGKIDLRKDLGRDYRTNVAFLTSPGVIYKDMIIVGFRTAETHPAPPGDIRAYDVRTGKMRWIFHTIPHPGEAGYDTWPAGAWKSAGSANNWAGMVVDPARGVVYVPTGSAVFDFYGGDRLGNDLFADTLLALDANTGKRIWDFQGVHHDIWDRDFPSPPVLLTVTHNGRRVDAIAQTTKQGILFLFDRVTGQPLFPIVERPVPPSDVPGEKASPTQPFPTTPAPFARQIIDEDTLTTRTPAAHAAALAQFEQMRNNGPYTPFRLNKPVLIFPGFDGGAEWGGPAVDPATGVIYVNANDVAWYTALIPNVVSASAGKGAAIYAAQCAVCHGPNRQGAPPEIPSLVNVGSRMMDYEIGLTIAGGKGRMPGFTQLSKDDISAVVAFLEGRDTPASQGDSGREVASAGPPPATMKYISTGYHHFLDPDGYPAVKPPWGTLNAIDLNTGRYLWKIPLGDYPALAAQGLKDTGTENYGGPIVTDGGLVFIGATIYDRKFRAFDSRTGALLWQGDLPYAGVATPITYAVGGRQYVVIATSGSRDQKGPQGSAYVAFALPPDTPR